MQCSSGVIKVQQVSEGQMSCWNTSQEGKEVDHVTYFMVSFAVNTIQFRAVSKCIHRDITHVGVELCGLVTLAI